MNLLSSAGCRASDYAAMETMDEVCMHCNQHCNTSTTQLTKLGNDVDVMAQMDKPLDQQVSYSIQIRHIHLQQHFIGFS